MWRGGWGCPVNTLELMLKLRKVLGQAIKGRECIDTPSHGTLQEWRLVKRDTDAWLARALDDARRTAPEDAAVDGALHAMLEGPLAIIGQGDYASIIEAK